MAFKGMMSMLLNSKSPQNWKRPALSAFVALSSLTGPSAVAHGGRAPNQSSEETSKIDFSRVTSFLGSQNLRPAPVATPSLRPQVELRLPWEKKEEDAEKEVPKAIPVAAAKLPQPKASSSPQAKPAPKTTPRVTPSPKPQVAVSTPTAAEKLVQALQPKAAPAPSPVPTPEAPQSVVINGSTYSVRGWHADYSRHLRKTVTRALLDLAPGRVGDFCENYGALDEGDRRQFWADFFESIAKAESNHRLTTRYREKTFDYEDPVTKDAVYSEGLLQLSYGDEVWADCGFNWDKDEDLDPKDPRKTIFNPFKNLGCGVKILDKFVKSRGGDLKSVASGYWFIFNPKDPNGWKRFMAHLVKTKSASLCKVAKSK